MQRRKTRLVKMGTLRMGAGSPVSVQSMTKTKTSNLAATLKQIKRLEKSGCQIIRVAVRHEEDARAIGQIKPKISIPLEADIHFNYRLALKAIENGADAVRLNPGNISHKSEVAQVAHLALKNRVAIRVGVNSGSLYVKDEHIHKKSDETTARQMVDSATKYIRQLEKEGFRDIMVSLKASSVLATMQAYRQMANLCDYPFHLGVTATGPADTGMIKSAIGIGGLLAEGIGDTIRVSLTGPPELELKVAKRILYALGLARPGIEIISCPTCGRCELKIERIVNELRRRTVGLDSDVRATAGSGAGAEAGLKIAVMGCVVNGPGEARDADIGIAGGRGCGVIFKHGRTLRKVREDEIVEALLSEIQKLRTWVKR